MKKNAVEALTISRMQELIEYFMESAARLCVSKCIDGRVHGSKGKGRPPKSVTFFRGEGNIVDVGPRNAAFWDRLYKVILDAKMNTPGTPALYIALGHKSHSGRGCAKHESQDEVALATVMMQAHRLRQQTNPDELYVIHGMTETDYMSECYHFPDGKKTVIDTAKIIEGLKNTIRNPDDVFQEGFLSQPISDPKIAKWIDGKTAGDLLDGRKGYAMFNSLQYGIAMETLLMRSIAGIAASKGKVNKVIHPELFKIVWGKLNNIKGLPEGLRGSLLYQIIFNIAYSLYKRKQIPNMSQEERVKELDHGEELICFGDGFELLSRNSAILAKIGRGDNTEALRTAQNVWKHRFGETKTPKIHMNIEVPGKITSWNSFTSYVLNKLETMRAEVIEVFGTNVHIMATYSYEDRKMFLPVQTLIYGRQSIDEKRVFPMNIVEGMQSHEYTESNLVLRERDYAAAICAA
ncbi:MAG: hypothetical protein PHO54_04245 [Candidatus Peribacteraceae bacterium]|nr:hypothetical protein [Candidatus Peribacteraceae bacterium]